MRWIAAWVARKPEPASAAGQYCGRHVRAACARPDTRKAAPTSCTKCGLKGPVSGTPGTLAHQVALAKSITSPLAVLKTASIAAIHRRMMTSCATDEQGRPRVTKASKKSEASPFGHGSVCTGLAKD